MESQHPYKDLSIVDYTALEHPENLWSELVSKCEDAWINHSLASFQYNYCAAEKSGVANRSFFLFLRDKPVGLIPFVTQSVKYKEKHFIEARLYSGPLPWPAFNHSSLQKEGIPLETVEAFAFSEIDKRATLSKLSKVSIQLSPPVPNYEKSQNRFNKVVRDWKYLDCRYLSHTIQINENCLDQVRDRFRRYYKKYSPLFELHIYEGDKVSDALEERYFQLHIKDAGGQFRSRESYKKQIDIIRKHEGILVAAKLREKNEIVGMLQVGIFKNNAYDSSVGIDPDYREMYVSHLLKWKTIEELIKRKIENYELGVVATAPSLAKIFSAKQHGISHFKEGWARDNTKTVFVAEKYYDREILKATLENQMEYLEEYFEIRKRYEGQ